MTTVGRVVRAFFKALAMTLRGETAGPPSIVETARARYPALIGWCEGSLVHLEAVIAAAEAAGWTDDRRAAFSLRLEGRDVSLKTMLAAVRYHCAEEIPHLLASDSRYGRVGAHALVINDQYWARQFSAADALPAAVSAALVTLADHLAAPPNDRPAEAGAEAGASAG